MVAGDATRNGFLRAARRGALAALLASPLCAARPVPFAAVAQEPAPATAARQVELLLRDRATRGEPLVAALVALGPAAIPAALDALRDADAPVVVDAATDATPPLRIAPETRVAVHAALARLGRAQVVAALRERLAWSQEPSERRVTLSVLGTLGTGEDLDLLLQVATPPEGAPGFDSRASTLAQGALEQLFDRDPPAQDEAARRLVAAHVEVAPVLARALGSRRSPESFARLAGALGKRADLDLVVIPVLARSEGRFGSPLRARALDHVRAALASPDPMLARSAAAACGDLLDAGAAPSLCDLLASPDAQLAAAAHRALVRITGLAFAPQPERWRQWLQAEDAWLQEESEALLQVLGEPDADLALAALQTLALHPLQRELLAPRIAELTAHAEPALRAHACAVLGRLRWPGSQAFLREQARDRSELVARAATDALRVLASHADAAR